MEPDGISDIEGKVARVATSKLGNERVSIRHGTCRHSARWRVTAECPRHAGASTFQRYAAIAVLELGSVPLPVVTARIDRFIAENGRGPYPDME